MLQVQVPDFEIHFPNKYTSASQVPVNEYTVSLTELENLFNSAPNSSKTGNWQNGHRFGDRNIALVDEAGNKLEAIDPTKTLILFQHHVHRASISYGRGYLEEEIVNAYIYNPVEQ